MVAPSPRAKAALRSRSAKQTSAGTPKTMIRIIASGTDSALATQASPGTMPASASGTATASHRSDGRRGSAEGGGRSRHASTMASGYSMTSRNRVGATRALNTPPRTPPAAIVR